MLRHIRMCKSIRTIALCCAAMLFLAACSETTARLEHNDPSKYRLTEDVLWASPEGIDLTMDIYGPGAGAGPYPVIVMFHGGGWLINDQSIMDQSAAYLATNANYVVCNVNYRLLSQNGNSVAFNQIIEDALGAVLWVKDNIGQYGGDPAQIAVTGDSAGAHLSAAVINLGENLRSHGFTRRPFGFNPTYRPEGKTAEELAQSKALTVQAGVLSYGLFDIYNAAIEGYESNANIFWLMSGSFARGIFGAAYNVQDDAERYRAVSPNYNIPHADKRKLPPQLLTAGSADELVTPASVKSYANHLIQAGHKAQYWVHEGRGHAFLDSGKNVVLGHDFAHDAPPALDVMIEFFDSVFYP